MGAIEVNDIKLYAFHGCLEEEEKIGQEYIIDVWINTDLKKASEKDDLSGTIDYCEVFDIVKKEMAIRSKLIETVGLRIAKGIKAHWESAEKVIVKVRKPRPPIHGDVGEVSVSVTA